MVDKDNNSEFDTQSDNTVHNEEQNVQPQNTQNEQEAAATSENQYRFSKNDIPFNGAENNSNSNNSNSNNFNTYNSNEYNSNENNTNTSYGQSNNGYYGNVNYNNATGYNGNAYQSNGYNEYNNNNYNGNYNSSYNNGGYNNNGYNNNGYGTNYNNGYYQTNQENTNQANINHAKAHKKKNKKAGAPAFFKNKVVRLVASALLFGVIAGGVMFGLYYAGVKIFPNKSANNYQIQTVTPGITSQSHIENEDTATVGMNVEAVAQAALPAMVQLTGTTTVTSNSGFGYGIWGGQQSQEAQTSGTGIIVGKNDTELLILTNAHVIDSVKNLKCTFVDTASIDCSVKGSKSEKDIAVVAVDLSDIPADTLGKIAIAELGESDDVVLGQQVVAIGNALGEGQSVTSGIISALDRSITVSNVTFSGLFLTDAAINSGNSGGALLNAAGKVIGINFAKTSDSGVEGMAYSIPVSNVRDLIDSLMTREKRSMVSADKASFLGITGMDITSSMAQAYSYPQGVMINQVQSGSAAEKAGLGQYDILVSFDDQTITSMSGLQSIMQYYSAGETVKVEYYHIEGNEYILKTVDVTLGNKN